MRRQQRSEGVTGARVERWETDAHLDAFRALPAGNEVPQPDVTQQRAATGRVAGAILASAPGQNPNKQGSEPIKLLPADELESVAE